MKRNRANWNAALWIGGSVAVAAAAVYCLLALLGGESDAPGDDIARQPSALIADVEPSAAPATNVCQEAVTRIASGDGTTSADAQGRLAEAGTNVEARSAGSAALEKIAMEPVKGLAEQLLMMATPTSKGSPVPPLPISDEMGEEFEREAEAMLNRVVEVEDHDDERSLQVKERLLRLREEWYDAKRNGMTFAEFLKRRQARAEDDETHLNEAIALEREHYNDSSLSDGEYLDARRKIDNLLKMEGYDGLPPLEETTEAEMAASDEQAAAAGGDPAQPDAKAN